MCQTKVVAKIKTCISCSISFFLYNRAVSDIMWKNTAQPDRPQTTIWRMRISRWIPKATNTHSEFVKLTALHCNNGWTHVPQCYIIRTLLVLFYINIKLYLTLTLLKWKIWWAPNNISRWQMGFNSAFKWLWSPLHEQEFISELRVYACVWSSIWLFDSIKSFGYSLEHTLNRAENRLFWYYRLSF